MFEDLHKGEEVASEFKSFNSVGIDIGSTTTQLVFSKLFFGFPRAQLVFSKLTPGVVRKKHKYDIVKREVTNLSKISFTPFDDAYNIDIERLSIILSSAYEDAGYSKDDIDTGAIIITGVAALRRNAKRILNLFTDQMGKFVCATAGPNYEAILAAYGSGAVMQSWRERATVMNVDVGGGTTKIAVIQRGEVVDTVCLYVGARHIVLDNKNKVLRIEKPAEILAIDKGFKVALGEVISLEQQRSIASIQADSLFEVITNGILSPLTERLMQTPPLEFKGKPNIIIFSGGVSEYIYGYESKNFGDLGIVLGEEIRKRISDLGVLVLEPAERIRATVIGESQYTLQVSGNTTLISCLDLLPMRNLPIVAPQFVSNILRQEDMKKEILRAIEMHDLDPIEDAFALAFRRSVISQRVRARPDSWLKYYRLMKTLSEAIFSVLKGKIEDGKPVILIFEADIGMSMGRVFQEEISPGCNLVSIDEIRLNNFNFIDIGEPMGDRDLIPVIIKSLVFLNQSKYEGL